jgi:hypothetical protein
MAEMVYISLFALIILKGQFLGKEFYTSWA